MKRTIAILLALMLLLSLAACAKPAEVDQPQKAVAADTEQSGETKTLTFWVSEAMNNEADMQSPEEDWLISKLCRKFEDEHPGVKINMVSYPNGEEIHQLFKAAAMTEECPDVLCVWAGNQLFQLEELLVDLTDLIPAADKEEIIAWDTVTLNMEAGNKILAYPNSGNEICGIFYNRQILAACGLDYDTKPPADLDAFEADLQTIKDAGYTPIYATDGGWGHSFLTAFAAWWLQLSGSARVASDGRAETKFSDDAGFLQAMQIPADLYAQGYINADYASSADDLAQFLTGNAAFLATGNWNAATCTDALGAENVGFFAPPSPENAQSKNAAIGGVGQGLAVSKTCKDPELAVEFLSFLNNRENHLEITKHLSKLPYRSDITAADYGIAAGSVEEQMFNAASNYVFWVDNTLHPDVSTELVRLSPQVITGQMSVEDMAAALDAKAAEVN